MNPWADEATRLEAEHGHYAEYVAWERWVDRQLDSDHCASEYGLHCSDSHPCTPCAVYRQWSEWGILERSLWFALFSAVVTPHAEGPLTLRRHDG